MIKDLYTQWALKVSLEICSLIISVVGVTGEFVSIAIDLSRHISTSKLHLTESQNRDAMQKAEQIDLYFDNGEK